MSVICQNFVQNAWRKDLCSNCFKSEADHKESGCRRNSDRVNAGRYIPQATNIYQSRSTSTNIHWRPLLVDPRLKLQERISSRDFGSQTSEEPILSRKCPEGETGRGILKDSTPNRKVRRRSSVGFSPEEPLVIGYGGRDYDSDESPWEMGSDDGSINLELLDLTEEDRSITKLTKNNTEFNSDNDNLRPPIPSTSPVKSYTSNEIECKKNVINSIKNHSLSNGTERNIINSYKLDNERNVEISLETNAEKKLNYYYFSTQNESMQSNITKHNNTTDCLSQSMTFTHQCKEMSLIAKDIPSIIHSIENNNHGNVGKFDNNPERDIRNLSSNNFPIGTEPDSQLKTSEKYTVLLKSSESCEASSDSDYSTMKHMNGESSTDTESLHEVEDRPIIACSSFLHGNAQTATEKKNFAAKPFETSSVSSTDMSTFSDDSDFQKVQEDVWDEYKNRSSQGNQVRSNVHTVSVAADSVLMQNEFDLSISKGNKDSQETAVLEDKPLEKTSNSCTYKSVPVYLHKKSPPISERKETKDFAKNESNAKKSTKTIYSPSASEPNQRAADCAPDSKYSKAQSKEKSVNSDIQLKNNSPATENTLRNEKKKGDIKLQNELDNTACQNVKQTLTNDTMSNNTRTESVSNSSKATLAQNNSTKSTPRAETHVQVTSANCAHSTTVQEGLQTLEHTASSKCKYPDSTNCIKSMSNEGSESLQHAFHLTIPTTEEQEEAMEQLHEAADPNTSSSKSSPSSKLNRQSKLAALALELEKARFYSASTSSGEFRTPEIPDAVRYTSHYGKPTPKLVRPKAYGQDSTPKSQEPSNMYPSIRRGRSLASAAQSLNLTSLPDLLPEPTAKLKKSRFSLKKLLKRGKDSETLVINTGNDYNPKAWKNQIFDRSRLSLEIIHPMDLTGESLDSTPTEDKRHSSMLVDPSARRHSRNVTTRARSLSALPQLVSCVSESSDLQRHELDSLNASSLERPRMDMVRKAGTVAERSKKYKAPRRTPSFSELRSSSSSTSVGSTSGVIPERPQKPPPPPRGKSLPPPAPPSTPAPIQNKSERNSLPLPIRPPPPKVPGAKENRLISDPTTLPSSIKEVRESMECDYANLGDIRQNITPKKPQRPSAVSFARDTLQMEADVKQHEPDNTYETVEAQEEEDHYTYLDELEIKNRNNHKICVAKEDSTRNNTGEPQFSTNGGKPPQRPDESQRHTCSAKPPILKKPWMDLQASYAAIAATNYESLAELITTAISEGLENLQKSAASLKWNDFTLESEDPVQILEDKIIYNASYKDEPKTKVTLMVTTQKQHNTQTCRNPTRPPVLAMFGDCLPKQYLTISGKHYDNPDVTKAIVYVLQRSKTTTVSRFAQDSACFQTNQHIHLRNACFVLLQLIHTLKSLQAEGIEEIDYDLGHILLLHTDVDKPPILVLLPGDKVYLTMSDFYKADVATRKTTLCQTTLQLLFHLLQIHDVADLSTCVVNGELLAPPVAHTFSVISKILSDEKASSLTQAKGLLEYMLWGPVDIKTSSNKEDTDIILQRWLDLQRAQMVKSMVSNLHLKISSHTGFHVYEEYQLIFLLQATVKTMRDIISKL